MDSLSSWIRTSDLGIPICYKRILQSPALPTEL
jgi:hypothetical protein